MVITQMMKAREFNPSRCPSLTGILHLRLHLLRDGPLWGQLQPNQRAPLNGRQAKFLHILRRAELRH